VTNPSNVTTGSGMEAADYSANNVELIQLGEERRDRRAVNLVPKWALRNYFRKNLIGIICTRFQ
jgi:hypothetical protein